MQPTDIAIIGLACRFPSVANPRDFWRLIRDGREATGAVDNLADFDPSFFNISPREACAMDPRQRLALELAWELFEDAFVVPQAVSGEHVAVYLGATNDDYAFLTLRDAADTLDHHSFAGTNRAMIANRVSYAFGMRGPSMIVDSGQSSSLAAVHLACESLSTGASPLAIAGGIHLNLAAEIAMLETESGAVSGTGHTYAFDERADGYVRGEGGGLVLLKPLRAALDDGNRIRAVILGSALGNAGHSAPGLTAPSVSAEADVVRRALSSARVDANQVDYVEAHATGTEIGDPVEAQALGEIFAGRRQRPLTVGSVATNIGSAGAAAGIAGLLKTVLALENGLIPPTLNFENPTFDLESLGLRVNTALTPWPGEPRRAGISSFGMGGTNAHVIVQHAPTAVESVAAQHDPFVVPWVLSARTPHALANQVQRLMDWVHADDRLTALDVGWSLVDTRSVFEHRAVVVGAERDQLLAGLADLAAEPGTAPAPSTTAPKTAFVFPGAGSQWLGVGQQLYDRFPVFAGIFDEVADALDRQLKVPVRQVLWGADGRLLASAEFAQPAQFTVQVALAALLGDWGVLPDIVLGDSAGEIAAAHVAGVLSLADAAAVVAARARLTASMLTQPLVEEFSRSLDRVTISQPRIALVSNVTGELAHPGYGSASYWVEQVSNGVRFVDAMTTAEALGAKHFVEMGPDVGSTASVGLLLNGQSEVESLLTAAGQLFTAGAHVDWSPVFRGLAAHRVELPTYGFARQRFWLDTSQIAPTGAEAGMIERLRALAPPEQRRQLVELVCTQAAVVLGHSHSHDIDPERAFEELGFGSMTGVELRNRLTTSTGLVLSRTLIFDYPTPIALADHLVQQLSGSTHQPSDDEKIWELLKNIPLHELRRAGLLDKLLLLAGQPAEVAVDPTVTDDVIDSLSPEALIEMALNPNPSTDEQDDIH